VKRAALLVLVTTVLLAANGPERVTRLALATLERQLDSRVERIGSEEQFTLLGSTRGVYLAGFGAVFSTEVDLMASAAVSPFRPEYSKTELLKLKQKKQQRIDVLKNQMREMLLSSAANLSAVPMDERVVIAVTVAYFRWEDKSGLPQQIVMQAPRKALLTGTRSQQIEAIQVQEY
jgi:hypothetical protein